MVSGYWIARSVSQLSAQGQTINILGSVGLYGHCKSFNYQCNDIFQIIKAMNGCGCTWIILNLQRGFLVDWDSKESTCGNVDDWVRFLVQEYSWRCWNGCPLQLFLPGKFHDRETCGATKGGITKSCT